DRAVMVKAARESCAAASSPSSVRWRQLSQQEELWDEKSKVERAKQPVLTLARKQGEAGEEDDARQPAPYRQPRVGAIAEGVVGRGNVEQAEQHDELSGEARPHQRRRWRHLHQRDRPGRIDEAGEGHQKVGDDAGPHYAPEPGRLWGTARR